MELSDFVPKGWYQEADKSQFLLRFYTILPCNVSQIHTLLSGGAGSVIDEDVPVWINGGVLELRDLLRIGIDFLYSDPETGKIQMPAKADSFALPKSTYLLLSCPYSVDGNQLGENQSRARLNRSEALVSAVCGSNMLRSLVFEAVVDAEKGGKYVVTSNVMSSVQVCDGPTGGEENWKLFQRIFVGIEQLEDANKQSRLRRTLEFYSSAKSANDMARDEKFFFYWTAIQIICEGKGTMEVNRRLQAAYDFDKNQVESELLWRNLVDLRNEFYHSGARINLHRDAERYLQLLILDLVVGELEFEPLRAALNAKAHLDLRPFGGDVPTTP